MIAKEGRARIVVGGQWGDEGKGLISSYLARRDSAALVLKAGVGPNAEHGIFVEEEGQYIKVNQLPLGWILNPNAGIRIGPGVAVNPDLFLTEVERFGLTSKRVKVDYRCPIITQEHIASERASRQMGSIGSTFSGSGVCRAEFVLRRAQQARDIPLLAPFLADVPREVNEVSRHKVVVVESSQGTFLSLALSPDYPNVTSDNVTAAAAADDVGLNWRRIEEVVMVVKAMPTREGAGSMGATRELSEEEIVRLSLVERSSIGGAIRRKAKAIDWERLAYAAEVNGATQIALTFVEHFDPRVRNVTEKSLITDEVWGLIEKVRGETGVEVTILNTGKPFWCIIDLTHKGVDLLKEKEGLRAYG